MFQLLHCAGIAPRKWQNFRIGKVIVTARDNPASLEEPRIAGMLLSNS
jgi:hypothetical protein